MDHGDIGKRRTKSSRPSCSATGGDSENWRLTYQGHHLLEKGQQVFLVRQCTASGRPTALQEAAVSEHHSTRRRDHPHYRAPLSGQRCCHPNCDFLLGRKKFKLLVLSTSVWRLSSPVQNTSILLSRTWTSFMHDLDSIVTGCNYVSSS